MATTISAPALVGGSYYKTSVTTNADGSLKTTTSKSSSAKGTYTPVVSTVYDKDGKAGSPVFESGVDAADRAAFNNPASEQSKAQNTAVSSLKPYGDNPTAQQQTQLNNASGKTNTATNQNNQSSTGSSLTQAQASALAAENKFKKGTRLKYDQDMRYPINLRSESQDVIKFSILEYSPSLAKGKQSSGQFGTTQSRVVELDGGNPTIKGSKRIGIITLPIPAGIGDNNTVGWDDDKLSQLQSEAASFAQGYLTGGVEGAEKSLDNTGKKVDNANKSGDLESAVTSLFIGSAISNSNISSRTFGAVGNNNTELLFNRPSLRSHSFSFSFYPRSPEESVMVRKIIRAFKQSMSVKRSETSLLLKAPHTFAIQYMTSKEGKSVAHPYLTRFKECALTSCNVDYTPDGTYMTYAGEEKSMTAYKMGLTFQELEPIFDDEYGENDDNVGF